MSLTNTRTNNTIKTTDIKFIFFGSSEFSVLILDELARAGLFPALIVTTPDKPKGRKLILTPPPPALWAQERNIPILQLSTLKTPEAEEKIRAASPDGFDVSIVASYGKIIPQHILSLPRRETLNVHPSLLPKLRGASPIQSAILRENETGVTLMHLDIEMDHGPIIAKEKLTFPEWPPYAADLEKAAATLGATMLIKVLPSWIADTATETAQDHAAATYCGKIEKKDAELNLSDAAENNLRKIRAYHLSPGAFFFHPHQGKQLRIIVRKARIENGALILERVVPEGRKEMNYDDFIRGFAK